MSVFIKDIRAGNVYRIVRFQNPVAYSVTDLPSTDVSSKIIGRILNGDEFFIVEPGFLFVEEKDYYFYATHVLVLNQTSPVVGWITTALTETIYSISKKNLFINFWDKLL